MKYIYNKGKIRKIKPSIASLGVLNPKPTLL